MKDFLTSIARTHLALIATSALVLALATAPDESRTFEVAEAEARILGRTAQQFAYLREEISPTYATPGAVDVGIREDGRIARTASAYKARFKTDFGHYVGPLSYRLPGPESSVQDIFYALIHPPQRYLLAPSDQALRSVFEAVTGRGQLANRLTCRSNVFDANTTYGCGSLPSHPVTLGEIAVDDLSGSPVSDSPALASRRGNVSAHTVKLLLTFTDDDEPGWTLVYEFDVGFPDRSVKATLDFGSLWGNILDQTGALEQEHAPKVMLKDVLCELSEHFRPRSGSEMLSRVRLLAWCQVKANVAFQHLNTRSSEIGLLTPYEAAQHFHDKAATASQKMSLLGQTVDQRVVKYVGPLVVLAVAWFLLGELTALRVALVKLRLSGASPLSMDDLVPAWFGTHSNRSSRAFAIFSVFVFPVTALTFAWLQSEEDINFAQLVTGGGLLITALCCALSLLQLARIRKELRVAFDEVRLAKRAERRAEIWKKLAERQEKREAKKEDDDPC